jgi:AraC-like DNA-binding protein
MQHKGNMTYTAGASVELLRHISLEKRVHKILEMVESGSSFIVRDFAAEFHLSTSHVQRLFKQETGVRLGEWLTEQKLQRAAHLLSHSYLSVKEITHAVGYEHTSSFIRAFERRFRQPPARYRKHNEGNSPAQATARIQAA